MQRLVSVHVRVATSLKLTAFWIAVRTSGASGSEMVPSATSCPVTFTVARTVWVPAGTTSLLVV